MRLQRRAILLGVARPHRNPAKAEPAQQIPDRAFGEADAPLLLDLARQIDAPPANHPILGELRTGRTHSATTAICAGSSFAAAPGARRLLRPASPAAL
jgi:hypothetical protein